MNWEIVSDSFLSRFNGHIKLSFTLQGLSKFRPRAPDTFIPAKEGDEFGGVDHGKNLEVALHEWVVIYGEMILVLLLPVVLVGLLLGFLASILQEQLGPRLW
jgi:hypothetical protein